MRELIAQMRLYRTKSNLFTARRLRRWRTEWFFMRRQCYVTWPLYGGNVLPALRDGRFELGRHTTFHGGCTLSIPEGGRLRVGVNCYFNPGVMIHAYGLIEIGDYTGIGNGTFITDATHRVDDPVAPFITLGMGPSKPVRIGSNVWIGVHCTIMPGVTIGDRAIIGANSVVTRDVEPYTVVAGAPARFLRRIEYDTEPAPELSPDLQA